MRVFWSAYACTHQFGCLAVTSDSLFAVFGMPDQELAASPAGARQMSPLVPGAFALEDIGRASLAGMVMAAPPSTVERRYTLALSLRALKAGAPLTVMAPKDKGGGRIANELKDFGCAVEVTSRHHQRICRTTCPSVFNAKVEARIEAALADGRMRWLDDLNLWSQPGIFSWDRIDPGTVLLLSAFPVFAGRGADLGCGIGVLARALLVSANVTNVDLIDIDRRAIEAAQRNIVDPRATFHWADVRTIASLQDLDFVVMNPPFHDGGREDKALGQAFIRQSHRALRAGGKAWLVANRHLPYESVLGSAFSDVALRAERDGFKVYEATK